MYKTKKNIIRLALFVAAFSCLTIGYAQTESFEQAAFKAMQEEIDRSLSQLKLDKLKSPYYISYLITDANLYSVSTQLGAVVQIVDKPYRNQESSVLIGNNTRNNLNFVNENSLFGWYGGSFYIPLSVENDHKAIRRSLWVETDSKYKSAAEMYEAKLTAINQQNLPAEDVNLIDLATVPIQKNILPSQKMNLNKPQLESLAKELSALFTAYPNITKSGVNIYVYNADALFLSSEKMQYKTPFSLVCLRVYAEAVAVNGEPLMDYIQLLVPTTEQLPSADVLKKQVQTMASMLEQLRKAPVIEESFSGPVMFEGEAVGEIIAQCFIENPNGLLAARKPIVSSPALARNYGRYLLKENKLEQLTGKKVITRELSVVALDNQNQYNGVPLIGAYTVDAEGVSVPAKTTLIEDGVLKTLLTDRIPTLQSTQSNGHNRLALQDGSLISVLGSGVIEVSSTATQSYQQLKAALIAAAKEEDYEYAYIVRKMANPMANVPGLSAYTQTGDAAFSVSRPVYIYRISVKDGKEELVRSSKISDLSLKSFKRIVGVSSEKQVYNTLLKGKGSRYYSWRSGFDLFGIPSSFIVPQAIVFQELEVEKDKTIVLKNETMVPNPLLSGK
jgi:hypothetical protein